MKQALLKSWVVALGSVILVACGSAEVGEECDDTGHTEECEDGALCTNEDSKSVCRRLCTSSTTCAADEACNGVSGTNLKSCQPDKE